MKCKCGGTLIYTDYPSSEEKLYELVCTQCGLIHGGPYTQYQKEYRDYRFLHITKRNVNIKTMQCWTCNSRNIYYNNYPDYIRCECRDCHKNWRIYLQR